MQFLSIKKYTNSLTVISLVWAAITAVHILFLYYFANLEVPYAIADGLVFNLFFGLLSVGVLMALEFEKADKTFLRRMLYLYFPMLIIIVLIWLFAAYSLLIMIYPESDYRIFLSNSLKYRVIIGIFLFSIVVILHQLIHYYRNFQQKELKASRLERDLQRSKVDTMQMQMQPHFLFNALNSISALTFEDAERTRLMLIKLSAFLRYTTKYSEKQLVQLSDELSHIDQYLAIEHLRFGERLIYKRNVTKEATTRYLPCLVLQPVVENAVKHGVNQSLQPVTINLDAFIEEDKLVLRIANSKDGESQKKGTGTGLKNLSNRLKILYSGRANLQIENQPYMFTVEIKIP